MSTPLTVKCTIAVPVFNREEFIREALDSALKQEVSDLEVLVVDNCSTDRTWEILGTYCDPRVRVVRNDTNLGLIGNFNRCLELAKGKYVKFLCSDDLLSPNSLSQQIDILDTNSNVVMVSTRGRLIDRNGEFIAMFADQIPPGIYSGKEAIFSWLWVHSNYGFNPFNYHPGVLLRTRESLDAGGFDKSMNVGGDVDLFLHLLEQGDLAVHDSIGCDITVHSEQESRLVINNGGFVKDLFLLNERYRSILDERNGYSVVMRQTAAISLGMAIRFFATGQIRTGSVHLALARSKGFRLIRIFFSLIRLVSLRAILKMTGFCYSRLKET